MSSDPASAPPSVWVAAPPRWAWSDLAALAVWTVAVVMIFGKAASLTEALFYFDITEINYPYRDFLAREIQAGRFSRWMPGLFCGLPLYSESQAGYFHPLKLLYAVLPVWKAFNLDTILSVWLVGVISYGWLRRHVGMAGALAGASVMGMGGFTWAHWFHTSMINALVSVPVILWGLESAWSTGRWRGVVVAALALACQVFAGHLQDALMSVLLVGLYGGFRTVTISGGYRTRLRVLAPAVAVVVLGVLVAGIQWIPSKELIDRSPRAGGLTYDEVVYGSWHPQLLPMSVVREAYGTRARDTDWMDGFHPYHEMNVFLGTIALALAVVGAAAYRDRWVAFWILLAPVSLLLMLGRYGVVFDVLHQVPILGAGRIPVRYHLWLALAVASLAAVGTDRLARPRPVRLKGAVVALTVLVLVSIPILIWTYIPAWTEASRWPLRYHADRYRWLGDEVLISGARQGGVLLLGWILAHSATRAGLPARRRLLATGLALLVLFELTSAHWRDVPTIAPSYWTEPPETARWIHEQGDAPGRVFGFGVLAAGEPGYATSKVDFFAARNTLAWSLPPVWDLWAAWGHTPIYDRRLETYGTSANRSGVRFEMESVRYVLTGPGLAVGRGQFNEPLKLGQTWVHPTRAPQPRARLMGQPVYARDRADAAAKFEELGRESLNRIVVEDPERPLSPDAPGATGTVQIVRDEPEHVSVELTTDGPTYLFLSDTFDPGWRAELDGRPAAVRPAQVAFRAVFIPSGGRHTVSFRYTPAGWSAGLATSLVGLVLLVGLLAAPKGWADADHVTLGWPDGWRRWVALAFVLLIAASVATYTSGKGLHLQSRWENSAHRFTWGAGVEGMTRG